MLTSLHIRDVVIIDRLNISFKPGFTVFTGETGAGKSILLDSMSLALGMRGDIGLIRKGAEKATVTAEFDLSHTPKKHAVFKLLSEHDIDDDVLILKRSLPQQGRSKAYINDAPVSLQLLKEIGHYLLEVHGQFDRLFDEASHLKALDTYASSADFTNLQNETAKAYNAWQSAEKAAQLKQKEINALKQRYDYYAAVYEELEAIAPAENEIADLEKKRADVVHYGRIATVVVEQEKNLNKLGAIGYLTAMQAALQRVNTIEHTGLLNVQKLTEQVVIDLEEIRLSLEEISKETFSRKEILIEIDDRLHLIRQMAKKFLVAPEKLANLFEDAKAAITMNQAEDDHIWLQKQALEAFGSYEQYAQKLSAARSEAAQKIAEDIENELKALKLAKARFSVEIERKPQEKFTKDGIDAVAFKLAANQGQDFTPLAKSASGGEMARIMLALKVILTQSNALTSIVFDEIDTGVGGAVASAIGERMRLLSENLQVLSITHSPQVAAKAHQHKIVHKNHTDDLTRTQVSDLANPNRAEEIARMLSGDTITTEARAAAKALLS